MVPRMIEQKHYNSQHRVVSEEDISSEDSVKSPVFALIEVLTRLARHKRLIAGVTSALMLIGVLYSFMLPVLYTATTRIMTPQQSQSSATLLMSQLMGAGTGPLAAVAGSGLGIKSPNDNYIGMLNSRPVADAIIQKFDLEKVYRLRNMTSARKKLAASTKISTEKSGFLVVSVTDNDKNRAAQIANAYTEELRVFTKTLAVTEASQRRLFYEEQLKRANEDLIAAEIAFRQIQEKKGLVELDAQAKALITGLTEQRAQIAMKRVELGALRSYSTENNPEVQLVEKQIASLEGESARMEQSGHSLESNNLGLQDLAGAGVDYLRAEHELQYRQIMFDLLLKQCDAARLDEAKDGAIIQVVEPAIPPDIKSSPHRSQIIVLFTLLGCLGACLYLYICGLARKNPDVPRSVTNFMSVLLGR